MDLSILIVNWNTRDLTVQCLAALAETADRVGADSLEYGPYRAEVIVVDNASADDSVAVIRQRFAWVKIIENDENVGFARGNNLAYAASRGRYVLLLNSDTRVHAGAMQHLIEFMEAHPQCGAAGARLLNADGSLQPSCQPMLTPGREFWRLIFLDAVWPRATYRMAQWDVKTPRRVEVIKGACLSVRRSALPDASAVLDDRYFMYTEEVDLCYRLLRAGWQLYWVPQATVTHFGEASSRQAYNRMYVELYRSKTQFYRKFGGEPRARRYKRLVRAAYVPRWLAAHLIAPIKPTARAQAQVFQQLLAELPAM